MLADWFGAFLAAAAAWDERAIFLRLLVATLVGAVIGLDREYHNKGAGIKTHVLVCLGSAMTMVVSEYVAMRFPEFRADMNRIGAQVVSGVGFLGVGTIIVTGRSRSAALPRRRAFGPARASAWPWESATWRRRFSPCSSWC